MTLSKIRFIQLNNCNQAYQWLKENRNERIILPLQPIVIEDEPNILPIQYFIPPDPAQEFEKYKLLFNEINLITSYSLNL